MGGRRKREMCWKPTVSVAVPIISIYLRTSSDATDNERGQAQRSRKEHFGRLRVRWNERCVFWMPVVCWAENDARERAANAREHEMWAWCAQNTTITYVFNEKNGLIVRLMKYWIAVGLSRSINIAILIANKILKWLQCVLPCEVESVAIAFLPALITSLLRRRSSQTHSSSPVLWRYIRVWSINSVPHSLCNEQHPHSDNTTISTPVLTAERLA